MTQPLYDYFSGSRDDNLVTNASQPPSGEGYCATSDSCFQQGMVLAIPVSGSIPLYLYWCNATSDSVTVASAAGIAFVKEQRCVFVAVVGHVFPASTTPGTEGMEAWELGISSELVSLPAAFVHRTLLVAGQGITATMDAWGHSMRRVHNTTRMHTNSLVTNALSYWTDNGAYYYGDQWGQAGGGGDPCNETSMMDVAQGLEEQHLLDAVQIWQLDDWWCAFGVTHAPPTPVESAAHSEMNEAVGCSV